MNNPGFKWNQKLAKARGIHPADGRVTIVDMAPAEIIKTPNRRSIEEIINALCMVVSELVEMQEIQASRLMEVQRMIAEAPARGNNGEATEPVRREPDQKAKPTKRKSKRIGRGAHNTSRGPDTARV